MQWQLQAAMQGIHNLRYHRRYTAIGRINQLLFQLALTMITSRHTIGIFSPQSDASFRFDIPSGQRKRQQEVASRHHGGFYPNRDSSSTSSPSWEILSLRFRRRNHFIFIK